MFRRKSTAWSANRILALVLGIIFALLGIIGFFTKPENSTGVVAILGIFDSDLLHNLFYLITGLLGLAAAFSRSSRTFNRVFGIVYIVIGLLSLIPALYIPAKDYGTDHGLFLGLTHMNAGDIILHLLAGVLALAVSYFITDSNRVARRVRGL
jgi:Domain of unknown function (DUF4383)